MNDWISVYAGFRLAFADRPHARIVTEESDCAPIVSVKVYEDFPGPMTDLNRVVWHGKTVYVETQVSRFDVVRTSVDELAGMARARFDRYIDGRLHPFQEKHLIPAGRDARS